jgi:hypothetical protein
MATLVNGALIETPGHADVDTEIRAARVQAAVVRSLLDELDDALPPSNASDKLRGICAQQAVEELAQLAHKLLTIAGTLTPSQRT